jgi:peptide/nickel transport system permease protein
VSTTVALDDLVGPNGERDRGYWAEAWFELRHDWTAMVGLALVVALVLLAVLAPELAPHNPTFQFFQGLTPDGSPLRPGSHSFPLGTDGLGRDELSRLLYGARVSLSVGVLANLLAAGLGIFFGGIAGMSRSWLQSVIMRAVDVVISFPVLLLAIALLSVTHPSVTTITVIIGVSFGAYLSRLVFTQVVSLRERDFVTAARTVGTRTPWILFRHVIPHVVPSVIVYSTLGVATAIQLEAALSYVGIGIQPPNPSWGNMISDGQAYLSSDPWLVILPGVSIMIAMFGFSLLGDGLRDALDPTLERRTRLILAGVR